MRAPRRPTRSLCLAVGLQLALVALLAVSATGPAAAAGDPSGQHDPRPPGHDAQGLLKVDPVFREMSVVTGGDFYYWAPGEFAGARLEVPLEQVELALTAGTIGASPEKDGTVELEIPVDSTLGSLTVFAGAQRLDEAVLLDPRGEAIVEAGTIRDQRFRHMRIVTVRWPEPGTWRVRLRGAGLYSLNVRGAHRPDPDRPRFEVVTFRYLERRGRPAHEGWFERRTPPAAGETAPCEVVLLEPVARPRLELRGRDGRVLERFELPPVLDRPATSDDPVDPAGSEAPADRFQGPSCPVPREPARFGFEAEGPSGWTVRRTGSMLREPRPPATGAE